jgi:hypothetical protein
MVLNLLHERIRDAYEQLVVLTRRTHAHHTRKRDSYLGLFDGQELAQELGIPIDSDGGQVDLLELERLVVRLDRTSRTRAMVA